MKFIFSVAIALCMVAVACAVNSLEQEFTCPIDGTQWKQRVESSANPRGLRLDLRQLGDVVDPPTLPQCPKCHFPFFSERLAEQASDPTKARAFARLKSFVLGMDFQLLARKFPSYFSLAQVQEFLGAPHRHIALSYQRASWQAEDREAVCRHLLEKAREHFLAALAGMKPDDARFGEVALLCGEVERRLGKWDDAEKRFRDLHDAEAFKDPRKMPIVTMQLKLIELRDSRPRVMDERIEALKDPGGKDAAVAPETPAKALTPDEQLELPGEPGKPGLGLDFAVPAKVSGGVPAPSRATERAARKAKAKSN